MNWIDLLPSILSLVSEIPAIKAAWDASPLGGFAAVVNVVQKSPVVGTLADIGSQLFPNLNPTLHAAAAALVVAHPNNTAWAQTSLNLLASTGYFSLVKPLVVDGIWGPKTMAAVEAVQAKLGLPVNGFIADAEYTAISSLLAKIG